MEVTKALGREAEAAKEGHSKKEDISGPKAYLTTIISKVTPKLMKKETESIQEKPLDDGDITALIAENPQMNASTFYNLLKSKGCVITKPTVVETEEQKQADSGSSFAQVLRADVKESSKGFNFKSNKFLESIKSDVKGVNGSPNSELVGFTKFKVVLLQEGMGNFRDAYWYSKEALQSAVPVFEGAKIYADHPSAFDEQTRPERTVRDILGNFEDVHLEEGDGGQTMLVGSVNILQDDSYRWARSLMEHAVEFSKKYPDKDFIGLSINANGDAKEISIDKLIESGIPESALPKLIKAKEEGIDSVKIVSTITDATSCDLVTEAGAGGRVMQLLEGDKNMIEDSEMEGGPGSGRKPEGGNYADRKQDLAAKRAAALSKSQLDDVAGIKKSKAIQQGIQKSKAAKLWSEQIKSLSKSRAMKRMGKTESELSMEDESKLKGMEAEGEEMPHSDEQQDIELIKKMIAQYMGDEGAEASEEECGMVKEAMEAYKEMGEEEDEAGKKAIGVLKLAKHLAAKKEAKQVEEADKKEDEAKKECKEEEKKESEEKHKESLISLKAENAKLKESLRKIEISTHVDSMCEKSKLPKHITKAFREAIGTPKSVEEVNKAWKLFEAGLAKADNDLGFFTGLQITPEKSVQGTSKKSLFDGVIKE